MNQFSRVLAAVDFSKPADGAFEYALALSARHRAELVVVHAVPPNQPSRRRARERLALAAKLRQRAERANVEFNERVQQGDPAEIILLHARSLRPDVIVVGTHQRSGMDRLRVGSVAERVAAQATMPVLVVPRRPHAATRKSLGHVVVAVDFSAAGKRAVEHALAVATDPADRITLVHVVPGFSAGVPPHLYRYGAAEYQDQLIRDARLRLQRAVPVKRQTPAAIHTRILVGDITSEINRLVDSLGADLLVVGVPRRHVISRALFGTTSARLLKATRIPVLAVPEVGSASGQDRTSPQLAA